MSAFLCKLWPYLFGGLVGWLLSGLAARRLKFAKREERIVEVEKEVKVEVEKLVEVEKPVEVEKLVEVEKVVEVEKRIEVDNPMHLQRIAQLEGELENAQSGSGAAAGTLGLVGGAAMAGLAGNDDGEKDREIADLKAENAALLAKLSAAAAPAIQPIDLAAAKAAGLKIKSETDFTAIEGIGPKINELIHNDGIHTFAELADTSVERIQDILNRAGPRFALAVPTSWPEQSNMAANNRWQELKIWQDEHDHGV